MTTPGRGRTLALGAAAVVIVGLSGAYASTTDAQSATDPVRIELVSVDVGPPDTGAPQALPADARSAISDTGAVVVYEADSAEGRQVWIRDRLSGTSRAVAETPSAAPGISGDGCVVAYSVRGADEIELTVVDRCVDAALDESTVVDAVPVDVGRTSPPALSFDGSTIVWSTGDEIRRYVRPAVDVPHERADGPGLDALSESPGVVAGTDVDVSADGATVVFVAGPGATPYAPEPANVYLWSTTSPTVELLSMTAAGAPGSRSSTSPTISADGTFVVFGSTATDLAAAAGTAAVAPLVVGVDRADGDDNQVVLADNGATRPAVSADGNHVAYVRGGAIRVISSGVTPPDPPIEALAAAAPSGRVSISQYGRWLVFATAAAPLDGSFGPAPAAASTSVWAVDRKSSEGGVVDTTTTTTSTSTTVPTTTAPPTTTPPVTSTAPGSSAVPSTTTAGVSTVPATTLAPSVVVTRFPDTTFPRVVVPSTSSPFRPPSSTFAPFVPDTFESSAFASPVDFGPTVVDAGRRIAPVTLTNTTSSALRIGSVTVQDPGFALVADACSGLAISPASSCSVEVQFAPTALGPAVGSATFQSTEGTVVIATLLGEGVAAPTLDVLPAVAGAGQTVTVFGAGFPAGSTVELLQPGVAVPEALVVDADGTFARVVVVLPHTPTGPGLLTVVAQPDVFGDVSAELLVSTRGGSASDVALRGPVGAFGR